MAVATLGGSNLNDTAFLPVNPLRALLNKQASGKSRQGFWPGDISPRCTRQGGATYTLREKAQERGVIEIKGVYEPTVTRPVCSKENPHGLLVG